MNRALQAAAIGAGTATVVTVGLMLALRGHGNTAQPVPHPAQQPQKPLVMQAPAPKMLPTIIPDRTVAGENTDAQGIPTQPAVVPAPAPALPPLLVKYGPLSFAPLVRQVIPAVVNIAITQNRPDGHDHIPPQIRGTPLEKRYRDRMKRQQEEMVGAGSGFIVDPSGIIVTNRHVVGGADKVVVSLSNGHEMPARLLGADPLTDIAVIKVDSPEPLPHVTWGDSQQTDIGDWILVAGNPFGFGSSVTAGIVSAVGRDLGIGSLDDFIQLDAPINPGNSGGPAFNMRGQVVAVNAAIVTPAGGSVGIGFGIPSEIVAPIVAEIEATGHAEHGWLGITLDDGDTDIGIAGVDNGGPAQKGGLRRGDIVTQVDNVPVTSARMLLRSIAAARPGMTLTFRIQRGKKTLMLPIHIGPRPQDADD
ncbi:S1C family serine protease [Gluconobacter oxydans]|uniref:Serine protease n=2 Tax=Gluconobacter oxydans TaxID=442 RepID=Q5FSP1_GLUOX|nr:trypsin-like peptidase domain-containing protein [Gluconobacter oxydans]AAW60605.1 Serine protease [Gluconobacter oxydans 621H]KXV11528.1 endopeptidase [Gluconobacter oxydans]KXV33492.1 endopeptidase [Gluconobacter oxydans]MBF0855746.1 PDZ domain-containing protein [Gluconobacter oxydans]MCP1248226.1 trypsin-like peptidase domain-containing protein [Gluconobacter oxydans]